MTTHPLLFMHITKTAGGTLKSVLDDALGEKVRFAYGAEQLESLKNTPLSGAEMVYGHFMFGLHESLGVAPRYACFVRHPVVRTISHYYHLRNVEPGPIGEKARSSHDINDFFERFEHWEFSNLMSRIIAGVKPGEAKGGQEIYEMAVANLHASFDFVGFQEHFPLSMRRLASLIDTPLTIGRNVNVGSYALEEVAETTFRHIEEANRHDLALYKLCLERYLD